VVVNNSISAALRIEPTVNAPHARDEPCFRMLYRDGTHSALAFMHMKRILLGTLVVGALDITEVIVCYGLKGVPATRILQSVARGLLGKAAFEGGIRTALLGLALHYFIAFVVVCVYFFASQKIAVLRHSPVVMGAVYGLLVYLFMNFVVVPLSAAGPPRFTTTTVLNQLFAHVFCVGIPTALIARPTAAVAVGDPERT
jgi:hypothetical protein